MRPLTSFAALASVVAVLVGPVAGCGDEPDEPRAVDEPTTAARVYYLTDTGPRAGIRLARELRELSGEDAGTDTAAEAVRTMIAGPADPDYTTTWNPDTEVLGVEAAGDTVEVDLSEEARTADAGSEAAALMVQQLVYTVTDVLDEEAGVQLLIEGEPAGELWGTLVWDRPVRRSAQEDVRLLVQVDVPGDGASTTSPLRVEGDAAAFEATVPWRVLDPAGEVVEQGTAMTSEGMTFAPFSFSVELEPGTYTLEVSEDDPSGGEAPGKPMKDTKTVEVR